MKRIVSIVLVVVMLMTAVPAAWGENAAPGAGQALAHRNSYARSGSFTDSEREAAKALMEVGSFEEAVVPIYVITSTDLQTQEVVFFNDNRSVPYIEVDELFASLVNLTEDDAKFAITGSYGDKFYYAERENGEYAIVDFETGMVVFSDYDMFGRASSAVSGGDILYSPEWQTDEDGSVITNESGEPLVNLFMRTDNAYNFTRNGYSLAAPLSQSGIPVYWLDGKGYMPVTTFADLFLASIGLSWIYNGDALFVTDITGFDDTVLNDGGKTLKDLFIEGCAERTPELAEYTYREMVLMLEGNYGLRDEHHIGDDFDEYLAAVGLKNRLLSQNGAEFTDALAELLLGYFGDLHSALGKASPFAGSEYAFSYADGGNFSGSLTAYIQGMRRYGEARSVSACIGIDGKAIPYLELGDTAYISFDSFTMDSELDYYAPEERAMLAASVASDNVALIHYANERINRENSPIKNVVIDLSLNGGGMVDSAIFVLSWVLGTCHFSTANPLSEAQYTVGYKADVNLDGYITDADHLDLTKLNVYCLISECSFSCGNMVPAAFKESGQVTLLGRKSGGGACVVEQTIAADGTVYQYSSRYRFSTVKNGSYYSIDQGVEPDFVISNPNHIYDRAWLTNYIHQLP